MKWCFCPLFDEGSSDLHINTSIRCQWNLTNVFLKSDVYLMYLSTSHPTLCNFFLLYWILLFIKKELLIDLRLKSCHGMHGVGNQLPEVEEATWQQRKKQHLVHNHKLYGNYLMPMSFQQHPESLWKLVYVALSPATHLKVKRMHIKHKSEWHLQQNFKKNTKRSNHFFFSFFQKYLQNSWFMPTIDDSIHIRITNKETYNSIWDNRHHLKQKFPIVFLNTRITSQIIFRAYRELVTEIISKKKIII